MNEAIQFTMEYSDKEIQFLDILIKRGSKGIWMDLITNILIQKVGFHIPLVTQSNVQKTISL